MKKKYIHLSNNQDNNHISKWDTTKAGSANDTIILPSEVGGTYNCVVDWGDNTVSKITTHGVGTTHQYDYPGIYKIKIKGIFNGFRFNNAGDKLKLIEIKNWGKDFKLGNSSAYFYGCNNLQITAKDTLNTKNMTDFSNFFRDCTILNYSLKFSDISLITNFAGFLWNCAAYNKDIELDTVAATNFSYMLANCTSFNSDLTINTINALSLNSMLYSCSSFNQDLSHFNTAKVTDMGFMFFGASSFDQDISGFDIEAVTTITQMLNGATSWSKANYDLALEEWGLNQNAVDGLSFQCSSNYSLGGQAEAGRNSLVAQSWTITDLGGV